MTRRPLGVAVMLAALVLAGCGPGQDELVGRAVEDAAVALATEPFAFEVDLEAGQDALDELGDALGAVGPILASGAVSGVADGPRMSLTLELLGLDVLSVRSLGDEELYVRLDLGRLAALTGGGALGTDAATAGRIAVQLRAAGVDDAVIAAIVASVDGGWIAVVQEVAAGDPGGSAALGRALGGLLREAQVTSSFGELDEGAPAETLLDVTLAPRAALGAVLGGLVGFDALAPDVTEGPDDLDPLPGTVLLADGRLRTLTLDLARPVGELIEQDVPAGTYVLRLDVTAADGVVTVEAPEVVSRLTLAQLEQAFALLAGA